jgi:hypothetical protein
MPCRQVYNHWHSRGTCGLHFQFGPKLDFTSVSTLKTASSSSVLVWTCDTIQCQNQQGYWTLPSPLWNYRIINILIFTTVLYNLSCVTLLVHIPVLNLSWSLKLQLSYFAKSYMFWLSSYWNAHFTLTATNCLTRQSSAGQPSFQWRSFMFNTLHPAAI